MPHQTPARLASPALPMQAMNVTNGKPKDIVVFSGGSAANSLVDVFKTVAENNKSSLSYVIPISDNGGSSSELIRVFGGPGIGDVRSRLVRLIPDDEANTDTEKGAIKAFFNYRLPNDAEKARLEWLDIVEARHALWQHISTPKKELIRSFLNLINLEIVKKVRPSSVFNFSSASIGNLFLTGARLFSGSFESAIYLLSSICQVPQNVSVLPAINTNFSHHISAGLANGTSIMGQNAISHPSIPTALPDVSVNGVSETEEHDSIEDANLPGSLPTLRKQYISFTKSEEEDLPARIERVWYINPFGQEIRPPANPKVIDALHSSQSIIYSIGSLYTSIIPSLILRGVGEAIASTSIKHKILILNSTVDRETGPSSTPFTALDFVAAIARACAESRGSFGTVPTSEYRTYVTHLVHLEGPDTPQVNKAEFSSLGIETIRLYGRKGEDGKGLRYDEKALNQALEATIGKGNVRADKSRRNTLDG
ncbi:hypothetical protein W97_09192 [Coniosporium apollinis CBS 100218]|uniref:Uncharacterized protein n=1 Tax=Coniosporium apollinis (strain CBS 100218) TaxID=1168221 RepID=R7Z6Y8_CONA1|nr:uncharacterized protein W97_09192 [Coniosporium apollinis CBS 100218]EON69927.1 hypothetical protein W97_09192 [Coniosporium apollinis CBS 100218]